MARTRPLADSQNPKEPDYGLESDGPAAKLLRACIADARANVARQDRDRQDWRNLLFERGGDSQWMIWDRGTNRYVERGYDPEQGGLPAYCPRPVTNIFGNKIDGIVSLLNASDPAKQVSPSTDDDEDQASSEVAEDAIPVLLDEIGFAGLRSRTHRLIALTDKVYLVPYYDPDPKYGTSRLPAYSCGCETDELTPADVATDDTGAAQTCETCGQPYVPATDPATGEPAFFDEPIGRLCCELVTSFEGSLPSEARVADATQVPWVLFHSRMTVSDIERRWERARSLDLDMKAAGAAAAGIGLSGQFADGLVGLSSPARAQRQGTSQRTHTPVVYRLQHDPIETDDYFFPEGLTIAMVDDQVLEAGPLPTKDDRGRAVKNVVIAQYQPGAGSAFGKPPADDLVPLQETRNSTEALLQLILMHDAAPRMFVPLSVTLEQEPSGAPGETINYRSVVPGEKPTMERGINPPEGLYKQLELIDQKMDEVSKLNSVLQGSRPQGDPTLGEVEILQERGMSAFKPVLDRMVETETQLIRLLLWIARQSAWSPRFRQVKGENGEWEIKQFIGAELGGSIDVRIDPATAWPRSPVMERMVLKEAFAMGLFPPPMNDPELASKIATKLNLAELKPSLDLDRKQIARKLDRWKAAQMPQDIAPPDPTRENLPLHLLLCSNFLKSEEFELLMSENPPTAMAMVQHVTLIGQMLAQQAAAAAAAQQPAKPGKEEKPAERGDHTNLNKAIDSGVLKPASQAAPASPMSGMVTNGALVPAAAMPQQGVSIDDLIAQRALMPVAPEGAAAPM